MVNKKYSKIIISNAKELAEAINSFRLQRSHTFRMEDIINYPFNNDILIKEDLVNYLCRINEIITIDVNIFAFKGQPIHYIKICKYLQIVEDIIERIEIKREQDEMELYDRVVEDSYSMMYALLDIQYKQRNNLKCDYEGIIKKYGLQYMFRTDRIIPIGNLTQDIIDYKYSLDLLSKHLESNINELEKYYDMLEHYKAYLESNL